MSWMKRFGSIIRRLQMERELDDELQHHMELKIQEFIEAGMSPEEARYAALRGFGGVEQKKEACREADRLRWVEDLVQDVRFGVRQLRRNPAFTAVALITLALGIGGTTAIFSVIEAVLLRPLPYHEPSRLVLLADPQYPGDPGYGGFLYKDLEAWMAQCRTFQHIAVYYRDSGFSRVTLSGWGEPEFAQGAFVSANFFHVMGVSPSFGRVFTFREEARHERVVVLSHGLWVRRFGGSLNALGRTLQVNGLSARVIGVMPATFQFPSPDQQFWAPLTMNPNWGDTALRTKIDPNYARYFYARWQAVGRLKAGTSLHQAQAEVSTIFARIARQDPDKNRGAGVTVLPLGVNFRGNTRLALFVLMCAVSFVLLIACSNVANLVLARGAVREREVAVRAALGAGRMRLVRQLLTESGLLATFSGGIGLMLGLACDRAMIRLAPANIPRLEQTGLDARVLAFTLGVSLATGILFGLAPAWKLSRTSEPLTSGGRGTGVSRSMRHTRSLLVITEFALAVLLVTGAGLLLRSFRAIESVDLGFEPERVLTMQMTPPAGPAATRTALYDEAIERARALPGVQAAGAIDDLFELGRIDNNGLRSIEGRAAEPREAWTSPVIWDTVRGDFFQAMGAPLLRGRYFSESDAPNAPLVVIIDEAMARRYWPSEDPIGQRIKGQDRRGHHDDWLTVIGVVGDMRRSGLERQPIPHVYEWYSQVTVGDGSTPDLVIRTVNPQGVAASLRSVIRGLSHTAILSGVTTLEQQLSSQLSPRRFETSLLGVFAGIALVLASVGIYGLVHYSVLQRTHEIGIRMALGAQKSDVFRLMVGQGLTLAGAGIGIGLVGAAGLTRLLSGLLYGVKPMDPVTFVAAPAVLIAVALLACYIPARRAAKVDPMAALRDE
jgi:predicted permease